MAKAKKRQAMGRGLSSNDNGQNTTNEVPTQLF